MKNASDERRKPARKVRTICSCATMISVLSAGLTKGIVSRMMMKKTSAIAKAANVLIESFPGAKKTYSPPSRRRRALSTSSNVYDVGL